MKAQERHGASAIGHPPSAIRHLTSVILSFVILSLFFMAGCVEVATQVTWRGKVHRTIQITLDDIHARSARIEFRRVFAQGWQIREDHRAHQVTFTITSSWRQSNPTDFPGVSLKRQRRGRKIHFTYQETLTDEPYVRGGERELLAPVQMTVKVQMPGKILEQPANASGIENDNTAVFQMRFGDLSPDERGNRRTLTVTSESGGLDLFFMVVIGLVIVGYVFFTGRGFIRRRRVPKSLSKNDF